MKCLLFFLIALSPALGLAQATPVYVRPNTPAATGHFPLKQLKKQAIGYDQFEWLWVRDHQGHSGWILKASALLPLDFSRRAILNKGESISAKPQNFISPVKSLETTQVVSLVERHRDWYKIIYKDNNKNRYGWVRSRYLSPYSKDAGYFFSTKETYLRKQPKMKSKIIQRIEPGLPIIPLNAKGEWALVKYNKKKGYIPFRNIKSRMDVAIKIRTDKGYFKPNKELYKERVLEVFANPVWIGTGAYSIELKAKPNMAATTVSTVPPWQSLVLQGYSIKRWGKSHVPRWGQLWWPDSTIESNVEVIESFGPKLTLLKPAEIYQIEKSPVVPKLRFASATHGVYRSFDGKSWYPLKDFKNGFPIKVTNNGTLFVGDKVSFDHGESFQHYIRWDKLFASVPYKNHLSNAPLQIVNVEPNLKNPKAVTLSVKVGKNKFMQFFTTDMGQNWRLR